MHALRGTGVVVLIAFVAFASVADGTEFSLFKNVWGNVLVATDTSDVGRTLTRPTPQKPVYYKGRSLGRRLGSIGGDREPDVKQINLFVAEILAKQGYLPAPPGAPEPKLFLILQWGYVRPGAEDLLWFLGYNPKDDIAAPASPFTLGAEVWRRNMRSDLIETILQNAQEPIYGIIITAFDSETVRSKEPVIYWQTRIGLPANGKSMAEALPVMLTAAGPAIGVPADKPVMVDADRAREGQVQLGEMKVIEYLGPPDRGSESSDQKK